MRGKWFLISVSIILLAIAAGALTRLRREPAANARVSRPATPSAAEPVQISLPVRIQARNLVPVSSPQGDVEEFFADVNQEVYEGQLLARISDRVAEDARDAAEAAQDRAVKLEAALLAARLEASRARADATRARMEQERTSKALARQAMLLGEGATPRLVYEKSQREAADADREYESLDVLARQAEGRTAEINRQLQGTKELASAKAKELETAQETARGGEVRSPVNGLVLARHGEAGKPAPPETEPLFQIAVNLFELAAVLDAEPSALARLAPGEPAMLFFAEAPGEGIPGTVRLIEGGRALIDFISPNPAIRPGMTAQIRLTLR